MNKCLHSLTLSITAAALLGLIAPPASAVIKTEKSLVDYYQGESNLVVIGKITQVTQVDANKTGVWVEVAERLKVRDAPPPGKFKLIVLGLPDVGGRVRAEEPIVLFSKGGVPLIHMADEWLEASAVDVSTYKVSARHQTGDLFPGRTAALVAAVKEIKGGQSTLLTQIEQNIFTGGVKPIGQALPDPAWVVVADVNGDGKDDLLVGSAAGVKLLLSTDAGLKDATTQWGLASVKGAWAAAGDLNGDKKADLIIGGAIFLNAGGKFEPGKALDLPPGTDVLGAAILDTGGAGKCDVLIVTQAGEWLAFPHPADGAGAWKAQPAKKLWTDKPATFASISPQWGDDGKPWVMVARGTGVARYAPHLDAPPADYVRLTGTPMGRFNEADAAGLDLVAAFPIDVNGDGRKDFFLLTRKAGDLLVNRGFGAFLVDPAANKMLRTVGARQVPFDIASAGGLTVTGADLHGDKFEEAVVIAKDGKVYEIGNPPHAAGKP